MRVALPIATLDKAQREAVCNNRPPRYVPGVEER